MTEILKGPGVAALQTEEFTEAELFTGDAPVFTTNETLLDQNADTPAYTVVGRITASKKVTKSNPGASDGSQYPIGITCYAVPDPGADKTIAIYRGGMFNPDRLTWHASFNTDLLKRLAFEDKQPTIFIKKIG
jgi:hypothetical protein